MMITRAPVLALALLSGAPACSKSPAPATLAEPAARPAKQAAATATEKAPEPVAADDVSRVSAAEVHQRVKKGQALLICAYDNDDKFAKMALEGAIPRSKFTDRLPRTPKNRQLIFYCA